jgi:hypothetical protein
MIMFTKLLLAHLLGDFLLQPAKWVVHKEANKIASKYLYFHILIHFGLTMLFLWDMELWWWAVVIALSHFVIDLSKIYANPYFKNKAVPFFVDQVLHLVVLYCCAFNSDLIGHTVGVFREMNWSLVTAVVFVTYPSAIIMAKLLEGMSHRIVLDHKSLPNAGKYIGIIERLFVLVFIILGRWEAIGLLITSKSVFRFNDLKESNSRKLTEYILIGTLLSFGLAILTGLFYLGTY